MNKTHMFSLETSSLPAPCLTVLLCLSWHPGHPSSLWQWTQIEANVKFTIVCSSDSCILCDDIRLMSSWWEHLSRTSRILPTRLLDLWPSLHRGCPFSLSLKACFRPASFVDQLLVSWKFFQIHEFIIQAIHLSVSKLSVIPKCLKDTWCRLREASWFRKVDEKCEVIQCETETGLYIRCRFPFDKKKILARM